MVRRQKILLVHGIAKCRGLLKADGTADGTADGNGGRERRTEKADG
jgi:hypothetical protein